MPTPKQQPPPRRSPHLVARRMGATTAWWLAGLAFAGCTSEFDLPTYDGKGLRYPLALAVDPSQRYVYAVGANFDRAHHGGVVSAIDTKTDTYVQAGRAEVPSFAAGLLLDVDQDEKGALRRRLYVPARDDDSVTVLDVLSEGAGTPSEGPPSFDCGRGAAGMGTCAKSHRLGGDEEGDLNLGEDPVAVGLQRLPGGDVVLHVAAVSDGRVTPLALSDAPAGGVKATPLTSLTLGFGLSSLVIADLSGRVYVGDSRANRMHAYGLDPDGKGSWRPTSAAGVGLPRATGSEFGRGAALSSDGGRLYVAYRSPNALLVIDVAPSATGEPRDALVDVIGLGGRPAQVAVAPVGPGGRDFVYVACFGSDDIWVVDPEQRRVVEVIRLEHSPYGLAIADVPGRGRMLYAAIFSRHRVAVIPIDEGAAERHQVVARIE